jgi:hypothetical protein
VPTRARINGRQGDCFRIISGGKMPLQVEKTDATVTVANPLLSKAVVLDANGMATSTSLEVKRLGGKVSVTLPSIAMYVVLAK